MRHAIYYTPDPAGDLHVLGSRWLGRDAVTGIPHERPIDPRLAEITAEPRRYGFHGTLKPPFRMKDAATPDSLALAVQRIAQQHTAFVAGRLALRDLDGFLALVPDQRSPALDDLAADCVRHLDDFRAPASDAELARRRAAGLTARQEANLLRWGYPYVFDDFRFHITLSRRLDVDERDWAMALALHHFAPVLGTPFAVDALAIATEAVDGGSLTVEARLPLVAGTMKAAS